MSAEVPQSGCCFRSLASRNGVIVAQFVLLAVTTTGWFVTAMREPPAQVEVVEILVAARDLPVGTPITKDDLKDEKVVKTKKVPKVELPPAFVTNKDELVDKRITRPLRAEEPFNPQDLTKQGITLPEGSDMVSLPVAVGQAAAGFIGPGSRVNVLATVRKDNKLHTFPLLVNMLIIAVNSEQVYSDGSSPTTNLVSVMVSEKQAQLLSLAKSRGYSLELVLRKPNKPEASEKDVDNDAAFMLIEMITPVEVAPAPRPVGERP
jgi:pilus assembly protein CpaB